MKLIECLLVKLALSRKLSSVFLIGLFSSAKLYCKSTHCVGNKPQRFTLSGTSHTRTYITQHLGPKFRELPHVLTDDSYIQLYPRVYFFSANSS